MNPRDPHYPNRAEWLTRPARRQVDDATLQKEIQARGGYGETNLWSGRRIGPSGPGGADGKRSGSRSKDVSKYRCVLDLDVGRTRGSDAKQHMFCLYFAKGCCSQGSACTYLHRLPTAADEAYAVRDLSADIFGREKRAESEGYRKGAGSLERDVRTLYVNYEGAGAYDLPKIRQLLDANFRVFGPINNIYIVHNKTIAFVRYDWRSSAEFAKEAIHKQHLVGSTLGEVITARWANEDPNPVAVMAQKRACEEAFGLAVMSSFDALPPEQKQARIMELQLQGALRRGAAVAAYPSTDTQFAEREALQRQLELEQQQQEEDEDVPYIPPDIYEEQQRLVAAAKERQQPAAAAAQPPPAAAAAAAAPQLAELLPPAFNGDVEEVEEGGEGSGAPAGFAAEPPGPAGVTGEAPEWERAWCDEETRERMRADPQLRERMRKKRNEAVYWSAYQAHYSAYANSYGHQASSGDQEQQQEQYGAQYGAQYGGQYAGQQVQQDPQAQGQEYSYGWYDWYAQQGWGSAEGGAQAAAAGAAGAWGRSTGYGAWSGEAGATAEAAAAAAAAGRGGAQGDGAVAGEAGQQEEAGEGVSGGETGAHTKGPKPQADGLSLLGTAYGSDEDEEDG